MCRLEEPRQQEWKLPQSRCIRRLCSDSHSDPSKQYGVVYGLLGTKPHYPRNEKEKHKRGNLRRFLSRDRSLTVFLLQVPFAPGPKMHFALTVYILGLRSLDRIV